MLPCLARMPLLAVGTGSSPRDPVVLSSDDEGPPHTSTHHPPPSIPVTNIPKDDLHRHLQVKESGVVRGQPGLFAMHDIPAFSLVCVYTWDEIVSERDLNALPEEAQKATRRYAVESPDPSFTLVIREPFHPTAHPAAIANEPAERSTANMEMKVKDVEMAEDGKVFRILALYTCSLVYEGQELTWYYGQSYAPVRTQENYVEGNGCSADGELLPSLEQLARDIYAARDGDVARVLARVFVQSSQSASSSDTEFDGRVDLQKRRSQPKRSCATHGRNLS